MSYILYERIFIFLARALVLFTIMPIHECAHGWMADRLGDTTPRRQGRLTLNPFAHLDLIGGVLLVFAGFGWAKPVQVDPRNFKNPKRGMALTALAGPLSNIIFAVLLMTVYQMLYGAVVLRNSSWAAIICLILDVMAQTNLYLAVFNLLPVPPLDGAKIFGLILPDKYYFFMMQYERYISGIVFILIVTGILTKPLSFLAQGLYIAIDHITRPLGMLF